MRTVLVERGVVTIDQSGSPFVRPPLSHDAVARSSPPRSVSLSEQEFFDQFEERRPGLAEKLRAFLADVSGIGVTPEFRRSLVLRWGASPEVSASPGYVETNGKVWLSSAWGTANKLGHPDAGKNYLKEIAEMVHGEVRRPEKNWPDVTGPNCEAAPNVDPTQPKIVKGLARRSALESLAD